MKIFLATVAVLLTFSTFTSFAQDSTKSEGKIREYSLALSNLSPLNVGIRYKKQLKDKTFFKIGLVNLNASVNNWDPNLSTNFPYHIYNLSVGVEFGLEFRKSLTDNFTFFHGPNLNLSSASRFSKAKDPSAPLTKLKTISQIYNVGVPYSLGILLHLKGHFYMSAEINPGLFFTYTKLENGGEVYFPSIGFANSYGLISLVYRR